MRDAVEVKSFSVVTPGVRELSEMPAWCASQAGEPPGRAQSIPPPQDISPRELRRMARMTRFGLYAADRACREAGVVNDPSCGLIVGITHASTSLLKEFHDYWFDHGPQMASPSAFSNGVTNAPLGAISRHCRLTRGGATIVGTEDCGMQVLHEAHRAVVDGEYAGCCAGAAEEYSDIVANAYTRAGWFSPGVPAYLPWADTGRAFAPAEGSAFAVLSPCRRNGRRACTFIPVGDPRELNGSVDMVISGAGGGPQDPFERDALRAVLDTCDPVPAVLFPKPFFGELFSVGALVSSAIAWDILMNGSAYPSYPAAPGICAAPAGRIDFGAASRILVISCSRDGRTLMGLFARSS
ncbi:MAG: hypothetical protein GF418_01415 [Chitinivibrionales bacterium]|nr:hypothetical protein [Chitinivibrionales bacterium]MBD3394261.1 hypothetical protein [Chitinivibrionales bacterium]